MKLRGVEVGSSLIQRVMSSGRRNKQQCILFPMFRKFAEVGKVEKLRRTTALDMDIIIVNMIVGGIHLTPVKVTRGGTRTTLARTAVTTVGREKIISIVAGAEAIAADTTGRSIQRLLIRGHLHSKTVAITTTGTAIKTTIGAAQEMKTHTTEREKVITGVGTNQWEDLVDILIAMIRNVMMVALVLHTTGVHFHLESIIAPTTATVVLKVLITIKTNFPPKLLGESVTTPSTVTIMVVAMMVGAMLKRDTVGMASDMRSLLITVSLQLGNGFHHDIVNIYSTKIRARHLVCTKWQLLLSY
mmetsp:Transcript_5102/g.14676  ORF Transcript_5102/g.14676 Transcript_5102/m.14676 type:complete len:301 (-) Transcript_5102:351-1253(-)